MNYSTQTTNDMYTTFAYITTYTRHLFAKYLQMHCFHRMAFTSLIQQKIIKINKFTLNIY